MDLSYWLKQQPDKPLYPEIEWNKPERLDHASRLLIVGGNKLGFLAVAEAHQTAKETGVGAVRSFVPDCLRGSIPSTVDDVIFSHCNPSGGLTKDALPDLQASAAWANGVLLVGDASRNSETAIVYENFLSEYDGPLTITRDAIDLVKNSNQTLVERENTLIVASFAQVQKIFQSVYYPKMLVFSMQLLQLAEALHKFTISYPCTIVTLHKDTIIIASGGEVLTQKWKNPMAIWRGSVATRAASYWLWNPSKVFEASAASLVK